MKRVIWVCAAILGAGCVDLGGSIDRCKQDGGCGAQMSAGGGMGGAAGGGSGGGSTGGGTGGGVALDAGFLAPAFTVIEFGETVAGGVSDAGDWVVTNTNAVNPTGVLASAFQPPTDQFEVVSSTCAAALAKNASCTTTFRFTPRPDAGGPASARYELTGGNGVDGTATIELRGLALRPAVLTFDATPRFITGLNTTTAREVILRNSSPTTTSGPVMVSAVFPFSILDGGNHPGLAPDASVSVIVRFAANDAGRVQAQLSAAARADENTTLALEGEGMIDGGLIVSPPTLDAGLIVPSGLIGTVLISNPNPFTIDKPFASASIGAAHSSDCTPLAPGGSCTMMLTAAPGTVGPVDGTLAVSSVSTVPASVAFSAVVGVALTVVRVGDAGVLLLPNGTTCDGTCTIPIATGSAISAMFGYSAGSSKSDSGASTTPFSWGA